MIILSHRGYWVDPAEKNARVAFERSFSMGFGTETDLRDRDGKLVISHDMADSAAMLAEDFFKIYCQYDKSLPLALNIKADGLQCELKSLLVNYQIENYFVFDMAVPDGLLYIKNGFCTFTRHSEFEPEPAYYNLAKGVWLDEFVDHWLVDEVIEQHLQLGKTVCIVSPELHGRDFLKEWQHYKKLEKKFGHNRLSLCTDNPKIASEFFNAKN